MTRIVNQNNLQVKMKCDAFAMKIYFVLVTFLFGTINSAIGQGIINQALYLGTPGMFNTTRDDCIWKRGNERDECPDSDITINFYRAGNLKNLVVLDVLQGDWLRNSGYDPAKENVVLIHGYAGGDNTLPMSVLRDAYVKHGDYNVFVVDWGNLSRPPCYIAAVHNIRPVSKCVAVYLDFLRNSGLRIDRTTCVGHSLGAHICGLMSNYLKFRIERIIGLDPARPLIRPGSSNRLDSGDAKSVQVIHTNAGYYGEGGKVGHVDFCVNGGKRQPYCLNTTNVNLCSHIWSICYLAQSIYDSQLNAEPCTRRCPPGLLKRGERRDPFSLQNYIGNAIPIGQKTPMNAYGSYCLKDDHPPFCPSAANGIGDVRCCLEALD